MSEVNPRRCAAAAAPGPGGPDRAAHHRRGGRAVLADRYLATTLAAVAKRAGSAPDGLCPVRHQGGAVQAGGRHGDRRRHPARGRARPRRDADALTAPTAAERIAASAAAYREILGRTGALFAVAQQAAAVEPLIAGFWQQGREGRDSLGRVLYPAC